MYDFQGRHILKFHIWNHQVLRIWYTVFHSRIIFIFHKFKSEVGTVEYLNCRSNYLGKCIFYLTNSLEISVLCSRFHSKPYFHQNIHPQGLVKPWLASRIHESLDWRWFLRGMMCTILEKYHRPDLPNTKYSHYLGLDMGFRLDKK